MHVVRRAQTAAAGANRGGDDRWGSWTRSKACEGPREAGQGGHRHGLRQVEQKVGPQHADKVDAASDKAKDAVDKLAGNDAAGRGADADAPPRRRPPAAAPPTPPAAAARHRPPDSRRRR